ncbi:outer membrane protein assembly factor BamE [Paracoccus xiamenensis]|uniref:outer membrane protein assembly factor BamE n=1 Tax=Paracoccus xiamenensis TaxID=2714901 RepID=UPI0014099945|nr:outer membrane protein assembly factor BamE [Paracoccus xiamenensis]NHF71734.1 outer membrane protein assembly factor BamE [Paracoccus xiamenensis]
MTSIRSTVLALTLVISGCVPVYRHHGYVPPPEDLSLVVVGQTTEAELDTLVGRPSSQGLLAGSGWYYVGSRWRTYGPTKPQEVSREVVAISFAENGTVSNVERFGLEQGRIVVLSRRVTDSGVTSISAIRQILGNLGNFNAASVID